MTGDVSGDLTGRKLGNYRVDSVLGKGGMSVMYKATDVRLGRKVALKVIGEHLGADAEFRERFVDEARNTSAIDHANIVPVYDFGELDGMLYIAMRLVDGSDLASRIGGSPMDPQRALRLLEQVADALDTLHEHGLVHLDMKPANVLVTGKESVREHVYIADFGLTRRGATGHRTRGGDFLGSPTYAAPEHLRGEPLDGRTDQYALACVGYACLTGNPPFRGDVSEVIKGHLNGQPPPVSRVAGLPAAVDEAIGKGMAKPPDERYASCAELVTALGGALRAAEPTPGSSDVGQHVAQASTVRNVGQAASQAPAQQQGPQGGHMHPQGQPPPHGQQPPGPPSGGQPPPGQQPQAAPPGQRPQAPPPGQQPQTPPPGLGMPPAGQGAGQYYPPGQQAAPPGQQAAPPGMPPQPGPQGYAAARGAPQFAPSGGSGGNNNKKIWVIAGIVIALIVVATVLVIIFAGGSGDDNSSGTDTAPSPGQSAPNIPVGPSDSQGGGSSESQRMPPSSIPIEPGS